MSRPSTGAVLATIQAPAVEVRDHAGELVGTVDAAGATALLARGWAVAIGSHVTKYLRLTPTAPAATRGRQWMGGSQTTRPVRADQTCKQYESGQVMGNPRTLREHNPTI
jgi:hypothetical protein